MNLHMVNQTAVNDRLRADCTRPSRTVPFFEKARTVYRGAHIFDVSEKQVLVFHCKLNHMGVNWSQNTAEGFFWKRSARILVSDRRFYRSSYSDWKHFWEMSSKNATSVSMAEKAQTEYGVVRTLDDNKIILGRTVGGARKTFSLVISRVYHMKINWRQTVWPKFSRKALGRIVSLRLTFILLCLQL